MSDNFSAEKRALIIGHFSTFGDIAVLDQIKDRLSSQELAFDCLPYSTKLTKISEGWADWHDVCQRNYTHLIVVCGPVWKELFSKHYDLIDRFSDCVWIGINLTMVDTIENFNPFDILIERDSNRTVRPDLAFSGKHDNLIVAGLCLVKAQGEYGNRQLHDLANTKLNGLIRRAGCATVHLDTTFPKIKNNQGIGSTSEFEAIVRRVDVLLTTRLHGLVLGLKNDIPVIAIDPIAGGDKVMRQARALGWSEVFHAEHVSDLMLDESLKRCLQNKASLNIKNIVENAKKENDALLMQFELALAAKPNTKDRGLIRSSLGSRNSFLNWIRKAIHGEKQKTRKNAGGPNL
jgi:hypothetical protein